MASYLVDDDKQPVPPVADAIDGNGKSDKIYTVETKVASDGSEKDRSLTSEEPEDDNAIIITGADAALHLLPLRDDGDPALTFRSLFLSTGLAAFQAVMNQIYQVC